MGPVNSGPYSFFCIESSLPQQVNTILINEWRECI
nr:MAG TPA: hypothetical protein [Caudoviricetes sp.]